MEVHFYKRHIGDYIKKTSELSLVEHGAYTVLLDHYYATKQPLPEDLKILYRLCRAMNRRDRAAVECVAEKYFPVGPDGLRHNKRADEELGLMSNRSAAAADAAAMRWHKRGHVQSHMPTQCYPEPEPEKRENTHTTRVREEGAEEGSQTADRGPETAGDTQQVAAVKLLVIRCRRMLLELRECGDEWGRLTLEHLVDLVKGHPRADLDRVTERIRADWMGQMLPAIKTPPMIVRQCLEYDEVDGAKGAKKNAPRQGRVLTAEELRERRMSGRAEG